MSILVKSIGAIVAVVVLAFGAGFLLPSQVHVERSILVDAPLAAVFSKISDFQQWDAWSPWAQLDPDASMTISGSGVGQTMSWSSENPQVGEGTQEVVALESPNYLKTHLNFGHQGGADAAFSLTPEADATRVLWSLDTDMREGVPLLGQPLSTYFGFFMDSMIGTDYETGLQNLKQVVEAQNQA
ncbi:hypothetical protein C7271_10630 [filamentous cyanobacterium CCP5]|nr:hypothetical protein C7271_10630 [filamentous cyanobacterium CCP5]